VSGLGQATTSGSAAAGTTASSTKPSVADLISRLNQLIGLNGRQAELSKTIATQTANLSDAVTGKAPQQGTSDRFYQRKEPTILLGNIKNGWEDDFTSKLQVRLQGQGRAF